MHFGFVNKRLEENEQNIFIIRKLKDFPKHLFCLLAWSHFCARFCLCVVLSQCANPMLLLARRLLLPRSHGFLLRKSNLLQMFFLRNAAHPKLKPALPARLAVAEPHFLGTHAADHHVRKRVWLFAARRGVADRARKCSTAARKTVPPKTLFKMFACPLQWQRLSRFQDVMARFRTLGVFLQSPSFSRP